MKKFYFLPILTMGMLALVPTVGADAARRSAPQLPAKAPTSPPSTAPTSGWQVMGKGFYHDELFISYGMPAENWTVTVEENTEVPGWYRFIPYNENSGPCEILGYPDDTYMYINATNPKKVYAEDFYAYGIWYFSNVVVENDWDESEMYATLVDGVIQWPEQTAFVGYDNGYFYLASDTGLALYLPGSDYKDFSMDLVTEHYCTDDNKHDMLMTAGEDIKSFSYLSVKGNHTADKMLDQIKIHGDYVESAEGGAFITIDLNDKEPGIYTTMIIGRDEKGEARASRQTHFIVPDNDIVWKEIGETTFSEPLYYGVYDDFRNLKLKATLYEAESRPGLYLLDNPYAGHPGLATEDLFLCDEHNHRHGIMVDATNPDRVYVLPSAIGVACDGDGAAWSLAGYYLESGMDADVVEDEGLFGTRTLNNDETYTVEMPYGTLMIGEKNYYYGEFIDCDSSFSFVAPMTNTGVSTATVDSEETVTYNMQGIRVPADTKGAVIVRQGAKVRKRIMQ